jgi:hypothetical protein
MSANCSAIKFPPIVLFDAENESRAAIKEIIAGRISRSLGWLHLLILRRRISERSSHDFG